MSLRRRLLLVLFGTVLAAWLATAFFSYLDARQRIGAMLDGHLIQAADLILALSGEGPARGDATPTARWGGSHGGSVIVYQIWGDDGRPLLRSPDAPETPLSGVAEGFSDVERGGRRWRVYGAKDAERGRLVQVAERFEFRDELAASVASHLMHPLIVALPALAFVIWLSVSWGLAPLQALAGDVKRRDPDNLDPLAARDVPAEARPLADALNTLFARVTDSMEKERRFTADAAHELRTPLAAIRTHAQVALNARDERECARAIDGVVQGTDRAARLVEQLLILARIEAQHAALPLIPVRLAETAGRAVAEAAPGAAEKGIDLGVTDDTDHSAVVAGDEGLLGILLRNLLDNAVRYTPPGGRVDVSVRRQDGRVVLTVADSGPGVPPEERGRAVERFHRIPGSGAEGSGLGLSIVARIAERHHASLALEDGLAHHGSAGCGLAVAVSFPA